MSGFPWVSQARPTVTRIWPFQGLSVGCHPRINILPPLRGSNGGGYAHRGLSPTAVFLSPRRGSICLFCIPWVVTHGCVPVTATRFDMVFLLTVGYHPRLCSCHRDAVRYGIFADRGLRFAPPTAGIHSPRCGSKRLLCNNYALCIMNYALKGAHGWDPFTAMRF